MLKIIGALIFTGLVIVGMAAVIALPTMWLWNWLMPELVGLPEINFCKALGLYFLSKLLFTNVVTVNNVKEKFRK